MGECRKLEEERAESERLTKKEYDIRQAGLRQKVSDEAEARNRRRQRIKPSENPEDGDKPEWGISGEDRENEKDPKRKAKHIPAPPRNDKRRGKRRLRSRSDRRNGRRRGSRSRRRGGDDSNNKRNGRAPPRGHESPSGSDSGAISLIDTESSAESFDSDATFTATQKLSRSLSGETEGSARYESYTKRQHILTARLFILACYETVESIRATQEQARRYFLSDLRKGGNRKPLKELLLTLGIFALFPVQKGDGKPKYGEVAIPVELRKWPPSLRKLQGMFLPDQYGCDHFSFELAKGGARNLRRPHSLLPNSKKHLRIPHQESHTRSLDSWKNPQKAHKRHPTIESGFQDRSHIHSDLSWQATYAEHGIPSAAFLHILQIYEKSRISRLPRMPP